MHLTAEQIKRAKFTIEENGYSPKEADDLYQLRQKTH